MSVDIEGFYERYGPMVLRRCRALLRNDAKAQDAMQDVFVALLRHQDRLQNEAPAALLLRVATNVCLNRLRTERRRPEDPDDERLLQIAGTSDADGDGRTPGARACWRSSSAPTTRWPPAPRPSRSCTSVDGMTLEEVARESGPLRVGRTQAASDGSGPSFAAGRSSTDMSSSTNDPTKKVLVWLLERAAQGELAAGETAELRARLAAEGRSLEDELARLARSNHEIHAQLDQGAVVEQIRRRAARVDGRRAQRSTFNVWIAPLALAGSLGAGILLLRSGHGPATPTSLAADPASESEVTRIKGDTVAGGPRLVVYRQRAAGGSDARAERLGDGSRAARGDLLQLAYAATRDSAYGVLLSIDGAGRVTQHLPEPGARSAAPLRSVGEIRLPSSYELDDAPAFERFVLVTSAQTFPVAAALDAAGALAAQGPGASSAPLALAPAFHQTSVLLKKTSKGTP